MSERDVLLATKVHVPGVPLGFVARPRLSEALDEGPGRRLALVCAPAGFGKTALLADWARSGGRPVGWLSLDAGDNDPARFWRHVVAALDRARPGISERVGPLLGPPAPSSFEGLVTALINELAGGAGAGEVLLILDDYHLIEAGPVQESVGFLVEHLPPGLHVVLASRADPPLPLARLRAAGQLAELRAADLRFSPEEAAVLLRESAGADLPAAAVAALAARTEGWVAGLQLAALSLRGQADITGFLESFSGSHRYVLDYLAEEVLEQQTEQVRTFLLETSVLERLSGELCDAVTGRPGGQAMLEAVEAAGLFLVPLDDVRGWWRYHHLFADLLRARLQRDQPGRAAALHRNAAAWSEDHGLADDAIRHAVAAGDAAWSVRLMERHFDEVFMTGENATLQRWLSAVPAQLARSRPRLRLARTFMALVAGDTETVGMLLDATPGDADEPFDPSVGMTASLLANVPAALAIAHAWLAYLRGDAESMGEFASQARSKLGADEWMLHSVYQLNLALADWLRGRLGEAERGFVSCVARLRSAGERGLAAGCCNFLGQVQRAQGRLDAALGTYDQLLEIASSPGNASLPLAGMAHVGVAEVAYQRGDLDTALRHITEGIPLCRQLSDTQALANGLATLARIRQAQGDPRGALEAMGEAERAAPTTAVTSLLNPVPAQRARLLLTRGDVAAAARWTEDRGLAADGELAYVREPEYLVLARVLLARHRPDAALALLERLFAAAERQDRAGSLMEIQALQALALAAGGEQPAAVDALAQALTSGCSQGYVRVFADEGPPMSALLGQLVAAQRAEQGGAREVPLGYLARVVRASDGADRPADPARGAAASATVPGLAERLTGREVEVLGLLAVGMPNPRIAEQLVVSLDTVKKHVSHVLAKLGAANRTQAVSRARQLGLIP